MNNKYQGKKKEEKKKKKRNNIEKDRTKNIKSFSVLDFHFSFINKCMLSRNNRFLIYSTHFMRYNASLI